MFQRDRSIRRVQNRHALDAKRGRVYTNAIAGFDRGSLGLKTPFGHFFITRRNLAIDYHNLVVSNLLDAIGGEIHARAVLRLIGVTRRVNKEAGLGLVVPLCMTARDALLIALIKDDVAFGD